MPQATPITNTTLPVYLRQALEKIKLPSPDSHKGQNGKLLIVGGSELFHAASKWSLDIASKFVDMVFYASIPSNNRLVQAAKKEFWNGIVIDRSTLVDYLEEADCILIGPGMERQILTPQEITTSATNLNNLTEKDWQHNTTKIVNSLLKAYPTKRWVIDAGALQMLDPNLLTQHCVITPHHGELSRLASNFGQKSAGQEKNFSTPATILLKGKIDQITHQNTTYQIEGGNAGMTKGGTGDVLAGLLAALYCTNDALTSCLVASYINKKAGDKLYQTVGPFFNASELVTTIPQIIWTALKQL